MANAIKVGVQSSQAPSVDYCISTPLGDVIVTASGHTDVRFKLLPIAPPALPEGHHVDGVNLLCITLHRSVRLNEPLVLHVSTAGAGAASTGEWLESMVFESPEGHLQFGLRDCEWLAGEGIRASWANYEINGLEQTITSAPAEAAIFVSVAWRSVSEAADDVSTWFAVDLSLPNSRRT